MFFNKNIQKKEVKNNEVSDPGTFDIKTGSGNTISIKPIQPIIFYNGNRDGAVTDHFSLLHNAPLEASSIKNTKAFVNVENINQSSYNLTRLNNNSRRIILMQLVEYIKRNTFINFCAMIDGVGPRFSRILSYCPVKETFHEYLFNPKKESNKYLLEDIIVSVLDSFENSFIPEHKYSCTIEETHNLMGSIADQLSVTLYSIMCYALDEAISETYLNVYNIPNIKNIYKETIELLELDKIGAPISNIPIFEEGFEEKHLGLSLSNLIKFAMIAPLDTLMQNAIVPSINEVLYGIPVTMFFGYNGLDRLNDIEKDPDKYLKKDNSEKDK